MGKLIRLDGVSFAGAPKLKQFDEIETLGSLMLFDASTTVGLPNAGQSVPNLLATFTQKLTGQSAGLDFVVEFKSPNDENFIVERTSKGGIHGIIKHNSGNKASKAFILNGPTAVRDYMIDNSNHAFFVSLWSKVTQRSIATAAIQSPFNFSTEMQSTTNYLFSSGNGGRFDGQNVTNKVCIPDLSDASLTLPIPTDRYNSAVFSGIVNQGMNLSKADKIRLGVGSFGAWNFYNADKGASRVIYRAYIEDLTVSGRTASQVQAIDQAMFNAAFSEGGKYHNDLYTQPVSI